MNKPLLAACLVSALGLLAAPSARAQDLFLEGHMRPLPSERLPQSIQLSGRCRGILIREWQVSVRGSQRSAAAIRYADWLCNQAVAAFPAFVAQEGLGTKISSSAPFWYDVALLSDGHCYRCMNDVKHRFANRWSKGELWGYTSRDKRYIFGFNQIFDSDGTPNRDWSIMWVHELWHAMSIHSGIFDAHAPGDTARVDTDERYAQRFQAMVFP